jgi:hypothetical protein
LGGKKKERSKQRKIINKIQAMNFFFLGGLRETVCKFTDSLVETIVIYYFMDGFQKTGSNFFFFLYGFKNHLKKRVNKCEFLFVVNASCVPRF